MHGCFVRHDTSHCPCHPEGRLSCLTTFLQDGKDCFLLACEEGHQEIVRELLTKDKVDQNVVDNVRN